MKAWAIKSSAGYLIASSVRDTRARCIKEWSTFAFGPNGAKRLWRRYRDKGGVFCVRVNVEEVK